MAFSICFLNWLNAYLFEVDFAGLNIENIYGTSVGEN